MTCASCGQTNPSGARFCSGCGASLAPRCPACGTESPAGARFCIGCGAALSSAVARPAAEAVSRKIVTVVFADLIGSVSLHERLDAESARRVMDRYHRAMSAAVDVHGGRVVQLLGDGVLAAFGVPRVAEDDAIRAVRAAVGMQRAFRELAREQGAAMQDVGLRVAVNTGEIVVVGDDETSVMGDPTNVAARLQQEARDGDVLVGEGTQRLVDELVTLAPLGAFALRGRAETVAAYRVVSLDRPASQQAIAFVGRDEELRRLAAVYDAAVAMPAARLAVLLGSPGLGKSRLVAEFTRRAGERATVLAARCDAAGGATFAPIAEALRTLLRIDEGAGGDVLRAAIDSVASGDDAERTRIAAGIGALLAGTPAPPEETFFVVRRLLAALASVRPVVLVIDDLQWAEPLLLDLVEHLVQWSGGVPLLVLVAARPELRDTRSSLATPGPLVADVVTLGGLDAGAATRLAANVVGAAELPAALAGRVLATSEGNPLFVAELVRMLVLDGTLVREGDRWITTVEVSKLDMPPTIQVLLAARIERLRPEDRAVLERAAVIGRQFSRAAVAHLLGAAHDLDARLEALRRSELIEPDTGWFLGEPALRFHHVLIRDAAYRRVLKETRAELHERLAEWIVSRVGDAVEHDETIGWHFEQAHQNLRELGPLDARGRSLGERAARHLGAAGRRALARDDLALAAGLLGRALDRQDPADATRAELALDWCEALLAAGDVGPAAAAIDEFGRLGADSERLRAWHVCFAGQLAALIDPQALRTTAGTVSGAAEALAAVGDAAGEAKAHFVHAIALARLGEIGACETALDKALAAARHARDRRRANAVLAGAPVAALWGPSPVTRASGRCLDVVRVLRITQGAPAVEAVALRCQAVLETLRGRGDAARRMIASSRRMVEELGIAQQLLESDAFAGLIELLEGDAEAAECWLRTAYEGLRERGLGIDAARAAALLGRALLAQGRATEAEALSHESEALAGDDLKAAIAWRGVRAEALAQRGEHAEAVEFARAAVDIASATDALLDHADARVALSAALRAAGRVAEADAEATRAQELWEAKGATLLVERARRDPERASESPRSPEPSAQRAPRRDSPRRVRPNAATANAERSATVIRARETDSLHALLADDAEVVHHPTGTVYGRAGTLATWRSLLEAGDATYEIEPLATLGDSIALYRRSSTSVGGFAGAEPGGFGAAEAKHLLLIEVDGTGRRKRTEVFATDHLADAIARLYERYAELLSDGPAHIRAASTSRTVGALLRDDVEGYEAMLAEDVEFLDHRLMGFEFARGADAVRRGGRTLRELTDDLSLRVEDVLALQPDRFVVRTMLAGRDRSTGGRFEHEKLELRCFDVEGRMARKEWFDVDGEAEALARFDEVAAPGAQRRRVRPNAATAAGERLCAAALARDLDTVAALCADELQVVHHPTGGRIDRDGGLERWRMLLGAEGLSISYETLATLGDSLALVHDVTAFDHLSQDGLSFGASRSSYLTSFEANARGQCVRVEVFADDRLADAIVRFYERYAELLPEGLERARAAAIARSIATQLGPFDLDRFVSAVDPAIEYSDHRLLVGFGSAHGAEEFREVFRTLFEAAGDVANRVDDVLGLCSDAALLRVTNCGTLRVGGGAYERQLLLIAVFGADGRIARVEAFDAGCEAGALARFDEISIRATSRFENAVTRSHARFDRAWEARDWEGVAALYAPGLQLLDRRAMARLELDRDQHLESLHTLFASSAARFTWKVLATRGDRLALCSTRFAGDRRSFGSLESEFLQIDELDENGRAATIVRFDPSDLDAAYAELDRRFAAGEGAPYAELLAHMDTLRSAAGAPDPDALVQLLPDDFTTLSHRRFANLGERVTREQYVASMRVMRELGARGRIRLDHLRLSAGAALADSMWTGTRDGGDFELPNVMVFRHDGRVVRGWEMFEDEQLDRAIARFAELSREPASTGRIENAATRAEDALQRAWDARDWAALAAVTARRFRSIDRRPLMHLEVDRDAMLAGIRPFFEAGVTRSSEVLATRGERLALFRVQLRGSDRLAGPSEVEFVQVIETDADGTRSAGIAFAPDALDAAYAELDARYAAGEAAGERRAAITRAFGDAFAARDWDALGALLAPGFVVRDHRLLGWEPLHGRDAYLQALRTLVELAPDVQLRIDHVAIAAPRFLYVTTWVGTREGGAFETPSVIVAELDAEGRILGFDTYDVDRLDEIRAGFDEPRPDLLRIPPNAASRAGQRFLALVMARDWDGLRALCAPGCRFEDRRRLFQTRGDRDMLVANARHIAPSVWERASRKLLATAGDRLAFHRNLWMGSEGHTEFEVETLEISEVDADGRIIASVVFDPEDRRVAGRELLDRYYRGEGARHTPASWIAFGKALSGHDAAGMRAALPDDFCFDDHRRTGVGRLASPDETVASVAALWELSADQAFETLYHVSTEEHGALSVVRMFGTLADGGAFESPFVRIAWYANDSCTGVELFELEDLGRAQARFADLAGAARRKERR